MSQISPKFPTSVKNDFSKNLCDEIYHILQLPPKEITTQILAIINSDDYEKRACLIRILFELPASPLTCSIIGNIANKQKLSTTLLYLFFKTFIRKPANKIDKQNVVAFFNSLLPNLHRYHIILTYAIQECQPFIDPIIYSALYKIETEGSNIMSLESNNHFFLPHEPTAFCTKIVLDHNPKPEFTYLYESLESDDDYEEEFEEDSPEYRVHKDQVLQRAFNQSMITVKNTLDETLLFMESISPDYHPSLHINICLTFSPPTYPSLLFKTHQRQIFKSICSYSVDLIDKAIQLEWDGFQCIPDILQVAQWIVYFWSFYRIIPLHFLNLHQLLLDSCQRGGIKYAIEFINAIYSSAPNFYPLPSPYTKGILEIVAGILKIPYLRSDVLETVQQFVKTMKVDISLFFHRYVFIPLDSFDRAAMFYINGQSECRFSSPYSLVQEEQIKINNASNTLLPNNFQQNDGTSIGTYTRLDPQKGMKKFQKRDIKDLSTKILKDPKFQQLIEKALFIDKYYFGFATNFGASSLPFECFKDLAALSLVSCPSVASATSRLFGKIARRQIKGGNLIELIRCSFPTSYFIRPCIKYHYITPARLNAYLCEILTSLDAIQPDFIKKIYSMILLILKEYPAIYFSSSISFLEQICKKESIELNMNKMKIKVQTQKLGFIFNRSEIGNRKYIEGNAEQLRCEKELFKRQIIPNPNPEDIGLLQAYLKFATAPDDAIKTDFALRLSTSSHQSFVSLFCFVLKGCIRDHSSFSQSEIDYTPIDSLCYAMGRCLNLNNGNPHSDADITKKSFSVLSNLIKLYCQYYSKELFRLGFGLLSHLQTRERNVLVNFFEETHPSKVPEFSLQWLQLTMHKQVLPRLCKATEANQQDFCLRVLQTAIQLAYSFPEIFYCPVARILITVSQSYPIFVINNIKPLILSLPQHFIQYRNIILNVVPPQISQVENPQLVKLDLGELFSQSSKEEPFKKAERCWDFIFSGTNSNQKEILCKAIFDLRAKKCNILIYLIKYLLDMIRYPCIQTTCACEIVDVIFEQGTNEIKEILICELFRRFACMQKVPNALFAEWNKINEQYKNNIELIMEKTGQKMNYQKLTNMFTNNMIRTTSSMSSIIIQT